MLGDLYLGLAEDGLEVTTMSAERALLQQIQDAQPGPVAEALIDLHQARQMNRGTHWAMGADSYMPVKEYSWFPGWRARTGPAAWARR